MRTKRRSRRGPQGQISQMGDYSAVPWRARVLLIVCAAVALTLGWWSIVGAVTALVVVALVGTVVHHRSTGAPS